MNNFKHEKILNDRKIKNTKHCDFCGHTISFYSFEPDKKLCNHCGNYNYRNDEIKFKDKLLNKVREAKI